VTVDGRQLLLIEPTVHFAYESMFPELLVISLLTALTIAVVAFLLTRNLQRVPDGKQAFVELIYSSLDNFVHGLIGDHYKRYVPLVGTIFIYILIMNLAGLIPGWASPTANINVPAGLAIVVVLYVQIEGIRVNGLKGYLMHFVGDPWWLGPLNFPIHAIGEVARVLSLTIRLFGNIFGEDVVIVILIALAGMFTKGLAPVQAPMYLLAMFTSFVQAMVFSILTCVYIALMTTHDDHGHGHDEHGHGHDEEHGVYHDGHAPAPAI
jgi:F-type H+-transporting ATPase subunit a